MAGLDLQYCTSPESHVAEFTCVICCSLVDLTASVTACSHAFCSSCLSLWLRKARRCPTCNLDLQDGVNAGRDLVEPLSSAQPLAYRVLRRVKVRCPWGSCEWSGDYGDLQAHMVTSKDHDRILEEAPGGVKGGRTATFKQLAQTFKEQANAKFAGKNYEDALALYSKALSLFPKSGSAGAESDGLYSSLLANRAACHLTLRNFSDCARDCDDALAADPAYFKAAVRRGKALTEQGKFTEACRKIEETCGKFTLSDNGAPEVLLKEAARCEGIREEYERGVRETMEGEYLKAKGTFGVLLRRT